MALTRDEMINIAVQKYFVGLNNKSVSSATDIMADNSVMWFSAAKYRYEGRDANIVHLTEFTETFETVHFHNFISVVDVEQQAIATRFHVDLTDYEGELLSMSNCNWFQFNEAGLIKDILIYNAAPLQKGFETGSAV